MRRLLSWAVLAAVLAACLPAGPASPTLSATATPVTPTSTPVPPVDLTPPELAAMAALNEAAGIPFENIAVLSAEPVNWPDSCLGVVHVGLGCAAAMTPGFRIRLEAHGLQYEYHTSQDASAVTAATQVLVWHREAGAAGLCDDLQVYLAGETYGSSCRTGEAYPPAQLTPGELDELLDWVRTYGLVVIEQTDPAAEATTLRLSLVGRGSRPPTAPEQAALLSWAQAVYDKLKPCC